ncbi:hypothetical protein H112_08221 [Trichophyton rubrum D6]|uniref:Uncharacterized protein n=5 Tax=Trichophyton TaxID=5550 RepID=F2SD92_TRIRC|nr:uncharacterized protein TERG_00792 [Trichophyton rubrum CBS 118892]EZF10520.1 hypothetical protein H100_08245 [Trichophyton rubrum MR850]EZF37390.1 hypothetical protein H102_08202 [Trichophyton rubrum CBS 100081]EZF48029.1 hypothetical protein H103_08227 [Trichophyton rubrum CBS 288.86]EZF58685.1 hypothetical protein H104_08178 [Trichophyton rubrum CBS 289.86]EZF69288.1 hypothetical protein H105_08230 [Trichophyton soudanense CBS 452.61]EZF79960.1 hypothetical protein H110_08225 [Trichophy
MSPINSLWFKWKSLKLPWRRMFLVGNDLAGNTYWEFKDSLKPGRLRRIVKASPKIHYADVKVPPQWHQWLRYVRPEPPSIEEQQNELLRQQRIKYLAQQADERWASKPSFLDKQAQQDAPALQSQQPSYHTTRQGTGAGTAEVLQEQQPDAKGGKKVKNPWDRAAGGPSENWQPESWTPNVSKR